MSLGAKGATIGRGDNCDITLDHESISRQHARISQDPFGRWIVEDLESSNGALVDGERIKTRAIFPGRQFNISYFAQKRPWVALIAGYSYIIVVCFARTWYFTS